MLGCRPVQLEKCFTSSSKGSVSTSALQTLLKTRATQRRRSPRVTARLQTPRWWSDSWDDPLKLQQQQLITILGADGTVTTIGQPSRSPDPVPRRLIEPLPIPEDQGLCIGSVFSIKATNTSTDATRRVNLVGFCQSIDYLYESVEHTVMMRGGEVFATERKLKSGVSECLTMSIAIPLLFGVPPEYDYLKSSIKQGGGILHQIQREWWIV